MKDNIISFIVVSIIVILAFLLFNAHNKNKELEVLNDIATKDLILSKNNRGELVAKIESYQTQRAEDFIKFATRDSLTLELQKDVKEFKKFLKKQGSVTKFSTEAKAETTEKTEVTKDEAGDPVYTSKFNLGGWVFGSSVATKDSTSYDIGYRDNYSLVIGVEPTGFLGLGKGKPFGQITSSNPYNTVETMKVYQVGLPKRKSVSIGPSVNIGVDFTGKIQTTLGVSIQPEILTIKL